MVKSLVKSRNVKNARLHLHKSVPFAEKPETGFKDVFEEWNANFQLKHSDQEKGTTFSDFSLGSVIFHWNDSKSRVPFTFAPDFPETCFKW